ncbi:uncharacterized protein [Canis lupus baileyi]|uniref:uncharacterized protein n=1 Tax=Canis lupus baileyi TaxID=143281 RepID=UPI003B96E4B5
MGQTRFKATLLPPSPDLRRTPPALPSVCPTCALVHVWHGALLREVAVMYTLSGLEGGTLRNGISALITEPPETPAPATPRACDKRKALPDHSGTCSRTSASRTVSSKCLLFISPPAWCFVTAAWGLRPSPQARALSPGASSNAFSAPVQLLQSPAFSNSPPILLATRISPPRAHSPRPDLGGCRDFVLRSTSVSGVCPALVLLVAPAQGRDPQAQWGAQTPLPPHSNRQRHVSTRPLHKGSNTEAQGGDPEDELHPGSERAEELQVAACPLPPSRLMTVAQHLAGRAAPTVVTDALRSSGRTRPLHLPSPRSRSPCALTTALHSCPQPQPHPPWPRKGRRENTDREEGLLLRPQTSAQSPP